MLRCTYCQTENADEARLCRECGKVLTARDYATGVAPLPPGAEPPDGEAPAPRSYETEAAPGVLACSQCGQEVTSDAQFCPRCGKAIAARAVLVCPHCGQTLAGDAVICPACRKGVYVEYAGFWRRFAGYLLDLVILGALAFIPAIIATAAVYYAVDPPDVAHTHQQEQERAAATIYAALAGTGATLLVSFAYYVFLNASGGTWGKRLLAMRLEHAETGENIGVGRSIVRFLVALAVTVFSGPVGILLLLAYLWSIWDKKKQTWHDKAAGSVVVRT